MEDRGAPNPSQEIFWTLEVEEVAYGSALFCNSEVKKNNTDRGGGQRDDDLCGFNKATHFSKLHQRAME